MKEFKRVLGVDDGPFDRDVDTHTYLAGVMARLDGYVEGVATRRVSIDGLDSTEQILSMFETHFSSQIDYIMLNGITFAGFNICDITEVYARTGRPVVSVTRKEPSLEEMKAALKKHFSDYEARIHILEKTETVPIELKSKKSVYANLAGISEGEATELVNRTIIRGNIPEPVRLAHMIAGAMKKGENKGRS
ncbi:hypothetical protein IX51_02055 [uncultured archaeon]|nr:hypothetical protein IX51_02055 [uncultured archaeon]